MSPPWASAFDLLLALVGISGLFFGLYALVRGGRGQMATSVPYQSATSTSSPV